MNNETQQLFSLNPGVVQPSISIQRLLEIPNTAPINLQDVEDFSNVCRACATITEFIIPIFSGEGLQYNLAEKINKHMPIQVSETDPLPHVFCYQCASQLLAWHERVLCCVQADAALRARIAADSNEVNNKDTKPTNFRTNTNIQEDSQSQFYTNVKNILINYFNDLEIKDTLVLEFVCQKCTEKPALTTMESLTQHLKYDHTSEVNDENDIKLFIKNYITFEEILHSEDSDRDNYSETIAEKLLPNLYCPFCTNVFSSPTRLVCHLNKHFEVCIEDGIMCCNTIYNNKKSFVEHLQDAHVDVDVDIMLKTCKTCGFTTEDNNVLHAHIISEHQKKKTIKGKKLQSPKNQKYIPAVCPECNRTFSNKYNMFVHMKSHREPATKHCCDKCKKIYKSRSSLTNHIKLVHEGILNFVCSECGEAFPTRSARDVHARLHTGVKPYKCHQCGKSYRAKNTLDRHLDIHLNIRNYECEICSKRFRKKTHLDYHIKTHYK